MVTKIAVIALRGPNLPALLEVCNTCDRNFCKFRQTNFFSVIFHIVTDENHQILFKANCLNP